MLKIRNESPVKLRTDLLIAGWSGQKTSEQTEKEVLTALTLHSHKKKKRMKHKKKTKTQRTETVAPTVFDPTAWFRSYYENFFNKEQRLKKLTEMEDPSVIAGTRDRNERSTSAFKSNTASMGKKSFNFGQIPIL